MLLIIVLLLVAGFVAIKHFALAPQPEYLQGQIEARRVMVAGKLPGRISEFAVREGDSVTKGAVIAEISSPEVEAKKMQAEGAYKAARAQANKAKNGARSEQISAAKAVMNRAEEAAKLAKTTYERVQKLYDEGVLPVQKRDEAETQMNAANALVLQANGAKAEVKAYLDETKIVAPISGEVTLKISEEGEVVGAGMPIVAITDLKDAWAVFNIREDELRDISKGKSFELYIPALGTNVSMEVYYIASAGSYAIWKSSKESGGFDLKTFEIRLRPKAPVEGLRPGMTALWKRTLEK